MRNSNMLPTISCYDQFYQDSERKDNSAQIYSSRSQCQDLRNVNMIRSQH